MSPETGSGQQGSSGAVLDATMSLVGRLEDLSLGEILQIVSLSKRSGLLRLEAPDGKASLYIRTGKVIYSAGSDDSGSVLNLLLENGSLSPDQAEPLKEKLVEGVSTPGFREELFQRTGLTQELFQDFLRKRVEDLVYSFFLWEEGTFSFQLIEDETRHPLLSTVGPFFLDDGIGAQFLVMEGARLKDEMNRDKPAAAEQVPTAFPDEENWEQEFEEQLTGEKAGRTEDTPSGERQVEVTGEPHVADLSETDEFEVPEAIPPLPESIANTVVIIGLPGPLAAEVANDLNNKGVTLQVHKDGADGITRIRELRQLRVEPFVLMDISAAGITDDRALGGLETITTMWDLGFHLPVGLICGQELPPGLEAKLAAVPGLTILKVDDPPSIDQTSDVVAAVTSAFSGEQVKAGADAPPGVDKGPEPDAGDGEDYYDIQQEFSEDLGEIDLPLDTWEDDTDAIPRQEAKDPHMARLASYVGELNRQDISGEITLLALRFASAFASRAVLFLVRKEDLKGLGQFGVELPGGKNADSAVRSLSLPVEEHSIFQRVARNQQSYVGLPTGSETESRLFEALGGGVPGQLYLGPVVSMGKVAVLLYGDDYPGGKGLEPTHTLDIFLSHVGLALDRAFLEMKLKQR